MRVMWVIRAGTEKHVWIYINRRHLLYINTTTTSTAKSRKTCRGVLVFLQNCRNKSDCLEHDMLLIRELKPTLNLQSDSKLGKSIYIIHLAFYLNLLLHLIISSRRLCNDFLFFVKIWLHDDPETSDFTVNFCLPKLKSFAFLCKTSTRSRNKFKAGEREFEKIDEKKSEEKTNDKKRKGKSFFTISFSVVCLSFSRFVNQRLNNGIDGSLYFSFLFSSLKNLN